MGMFAKSSGNNDLLSNDQEIKKVDNEAISSIIDKMTNITGEVQFRGKTRIDGNIQGNVNGEHLTLSETGRIEGDVNVTSFNCYGTIEGKIIAELLSARQGCVIHGSIEAASLSVEPGASILGDIKAAVENDDDNDETPQETLPENIPSESADPS